MSGPTRPAATAPSSMVPYRYLHHAAALQTPAAGLCTYLACSRMHLAVAMSAYAFSFILRVDRIALEQLPWFSCTVELSVAVQSEPWRFHEPGCQVVMTT